MNDDATNTGKASPAYHYRQGLLNDLEGLASECQYPQKVQAPLVDGQRLWKGYRCDECQAPLYVNGGNADQVEPLVVVRVICGFCNYPGFARELPYPEDLCPCFGWVYLDDED